MWEQPGKCIYPTIIFTCEELEEEGQRELWPQSGGETTSVLSNGTTTGRWHLCHPSLDQNLFRKFNTGTKPPKPTLTLERLPLWASTINTWEVWICWTHLQQNKYALKSWRWYMYIFWHTITLAVVNAWLLYKQHSLCSQDAKEGDTEHEKVPSTAGFLFHYGNDLFVLFTLFVINQTGIWDVHKLIHLFFIF